jgi:hypothetical protein
MNWCGDGRARPPVGAARIDIVRINLSVIRTSVRAMGSSKADTMAALEAAEAAYAAVAALPIQTLLPSEQRALLNRLDELEKQMAAFDRRLLGRLISQAPPPQFGGASWAKVLARTLRISEGEAQRRITAAVYGAAPPSTSKSGFQTRFVGGSN